MSNVNERWARDQWVAKKLAGYLTILAAPLWFVSYEMSALIYTMPQWQWFSAVSVACFIGAIGTTCGAAVAVGFVLTNPAPLPGSNY